MVIDFKTGKPLPVNAKRATLEIIEHPEHRYVLVDGFVPRRLAAAMQRLVGDFNTKGAL